MSQAAAVFILSDPSARDAAAADRQTALWTLTIKNASHCPVFVQLLRANSLHNIDHTDEIAAALCIDEWKSSLIAQSIVMPGFSTLAYNMLRATIVTEEAAADAPRWMREYAHGATQCVYCERIPAALDGLSFTDLARVISQHYRSAVNVVAVREPTAPACSAQARHLLRVLAGRRAQRAMLASSSLEVGGSGMRGQPVRGRILLNPGPTYRVRSGQMMYILSNDADAVRSACSNDTWYTVPARAAPRGASPRDPAAAAAARTSAPSSVLSVGTPARPTAPSSARAEYGTTPMRPVAQHVVVPLIRTPSSLGAEFVAGIRNVQEAVTRGIGITPNAVGVMPRPLTAEGRSAALDGYGFPRQHASWSWGRNAAYSVAFASWFRDYTPSHLAAAAGETAEHQEQSMVAAIAAARRRRVRRRHRVEAVAALLEGRLGGSPSGRHHHRLHHMPEIDMAVRDAAAGDNTELWTPLRLRAVSLWWRLRGAVIAHIVSRRFHKAKLERRVLHSLANENVPRRRRRMSTLAGVRFLPPEETAVHHALFSRVESAASAREERAAVLRSLIVDDIRKLSLRVSNHVVFCGSIQAMEGMVRPLRAPHMNETALHRHIVLLTRFDDSEAARAGIEVRSDARVS